MIRIQPAAFFLGAALVLLLPMDWLLSAFAAAAIHELGHLAAICLCGKRADIITVGGTGARIHTGPLGNRAEFLCAAAGPMSSFLLFSQCRLFPKIALCGLVQGMFNLMPVYPLDGGRMLRCVLRRLFPQRAERIFHVLQSLLLCGIASLALTLTIRGKVGFLPILVCITVLSRLVLSKIPCKSA